MRWTDEHIDYFCEIAPGRSRKEIADLFEQKFGVRLTSNQIGGAKHHYVTMQGLCGADIHKRHYRPIGAEHVRGDGDVLVKVKEYENGSCGSCWRTKAAVMWERYHGESLPKGYRVLFADRDKTNFGEDNLVAVPNAINLMINAQHAPYYDRESLEVCIAAAKLKMAERDRLLTRKCASCGKTFRATQNSQRRCRECIDAGRTA